MLLQNLLEISKGVKTNQSSIDNTPTNRKFGIDTAYKGLAADSLHFKQLRGQPQKLYDENTKIMKKIISLSGTLSFADMKKSYNEMRKLRSKSNHVEVARKLIDYKTKLKEIQPSQYRSASRSERTDQPRRSVDLVMRYSAGSQRFPKFPRSPSVSTASRFGRKIVEVSPQTSSVQRRYDRFQNRRVPSASTSNSKKLSQSPLTQNMPGLIKMHHFASLRDPHP
jgi:hypothetical protein